MSLCSGKCSNTILYRLCRLLSFGMVTGIEDMKSARAAVTKGIHVYRDKKISTAVIYNVASVMHIRYLFIVNGLSRAVKYPAVAGSRKDNACAAAFQDLTQLQNYIKVYILFLSARRSHRAAVRSTVSVVRLCFKIGK